MAEYFYNNAQASYNWDYDLSQLDLTYLTDDEAIDAIAAFKQSRGNTLGALRQVLAEGLQRAYDLSPVSVPESTRYLLQEVFDRFVADRQTSLRGNVAYDSFAIDFREYVHRLGNDRVSVSVYIRKVLRRGIRIKSARVLNLDRSSFYWTRGSLKTVRRC